MAICSIIHATEQVYVRVIIIAPHEHTHNILIIMSIRWRQTARPELIMANALHRRLANGGNAFGFSCFFRTIDWYQLTAHSWWPYCHRTHFICAALRANVPAIANAMGNNDLSSMIFFLKIPFQTSIIACHYLQRECVIDSDQWCGSHRRRRCRLACNNVLANTKRIPWFSDYTHLRHRY